MSSTHTIDVDALQRAMHLLVRGFGSDEAEVQAVCSNLIEANLTGHDSHGIGMLPRYTDSYLEGSLKPNAHVRTLLDGAGTGSSLVDLAAMKFGCGDLSILVEIEKYCARTAGVDVDVWTLDAQLASYRHIHRIR